MKRTFEAFLSSDPEIRRQALAPFDYVGLCAPSPVFGEGQAGSLLNGLQKGSVWPGLTPVLSSGNGGVQFQLFRIDHAKLQ
ncbi:MAG TPA: hypothetical protein DDW73_05860 [Rhizobium sp.]|jgi:hypothetical protein|nr:hypothetical protein [Rhizobium sp.]